MIEIINFRASTIEPNPKEVTYWVDLNEDPLGGIIKSWDGEGHWRTLRVLEGTIVKVEERIHDWVTQKLAEQTEWVDQTVKEMTDLVHTWDGRIALLEGEVVRLEDVKQDKLIPGFGIDINENNVISSTVDLTLYRVVPELPTENIDDTKIYIIFDPDGTGTNTHKEYVYINGKWELLGEYADYASRSDFLKEVQDRKDADDELAQDIDAVDNKVEQLNSWKSKLTLYKVLDSIGTKYYEQNGVDKLQITYRTFPVDGNGTITSTSFDLQEATSTRNGLMANTDKIKLDETIPNLITEEQNARIAADSTITTNLNKEIQDREEAISNVSNNFNQSIENVSNQVNAKIDAEVTRSTNKDNDHDAAIANEITRAKAAEKANADAISQEISRATNAETNLSNDLQAEITRSINKDNSLQTSITNEITRATNAESELDNRTSTLESDNSTNKQNIATLQSNLGPIKTAWDKRGTKDGLLTLGDNNLIQSQYLPSYVDDVIDVYATYDVSPTNQISNIKLYSDASHTTTITGESGKSYIDVTNSHPGYQFRWSGTSWVQITSGGLIVGNITGTAYDGSEGNKNRTAINSLPTNLVSQFPNVVTYDTDVRLESGGLVSKNGINYGDQVIMTSRVFPAATSTKAGVMTAQDKVFLDSVKSSVGNFVTLNSDQNITGVKHIKNDLYIDAVDSDKKIIFNNGNIRMLTLATGASAQGLYFCSSSNAILSILGYHCQDNALNYLYIGTGYEESKHWVTFTSSKTTIRGKAEVKGSLMISPETSGLNGIIATNGNGLLMYNNDNTYLSQNAGVTYIRSGNENLYHTKASNNYIILDQSNTPHVFCRREAASASHIDLTDTTANAAGFVDYTSGVYRVSRSGATAMYIKFQGSGSTSGLELYTNYVDGASLQFRKIVDNNRISGAWSYLLDDRNWNRYVMFENLKDKPSISVDATLNSLVKRSSTGFINCNLYGVSFYDATTTNATQNGWVISTSTNYGGTSKDLKIKQHIGTGGNLLLNDYRVATVKDKYVMSKYTIDASGLDEDTYYPVTIKLSVGHNYRIEVLVQLDSETQPSWSTHGSGFAVRFIEEVQGDGWGAIAVRRRIIDYEDSFCMANVHPIKRVTQMKNSSTEVIYVRGGGRYHFFVSGSSFGVPAPILRTSTYTISEQSVSPTPDDDLEFNVFRNVIMSDDVTITPDGGKIARRDDNGYLRAIRYYTTTPVEDYAISHIAFFYNSDGYIRKTPLSGLNKQLMFGSLNGLITYNTEHNFIPDNFNNDVWINNRTTAGSSANTTINEYRFRNGNSSGEYSYLRARGFIKQNSNDHYALTGAGGHMLITYDGTANALVQRDASGNVIASSYFFQGSSAQVSPNCIELYSSTTPYIDFHYKNSETDFSTRIMNDGINHLIIYANEGIRVSGNITAPGFERVGSSDNLVLLGGGGHKLVSEFVTTTGNQEISGFKNFFTTATDGNYGTRAIVLRETNMGKDANKSELYAPSLSFYWGNVAQAVMSMHTNGQIYFTQTTTDGNAIYVNARGYVKNDSDNDHALTGGGGHVPFSIDANVHTLVKRTNDGSIRVKEVISSNYVLHTDVNNPYLRLRSGSTDYFIQAAESGIWMGPPQTNKSLIINSAGNAGLGILPNNLYKLYVNGHIRSSNTINAGESVDMSYGYINVARPSTVENAACFSWIREGQKAFAIGFNSSNQIVIGQGQTDKTITPWLKIGASSSQFQSHLNTQTVSTEYGEFNHDLGKMLSTTATVTGIICINLPKGWTSSMNMYEIYVYEYTNTVHGSRLLISGCNYNSSTPAWVNYGYTSEGNYNRGVRLGYRNGKCCILLGDIDSVWSYPQIFIANVYNGYSAVGSWKTGYTIDVITSTSDVNYIIKVPRSYSHSAGFMKDNSSDAYVLLGGGGHKLLSEIVGGDVGGDYLPISGGTLTGTLTIASTISSQFREGIRITRASNNYAGITFGSTGTSGAPINGWFAALNPDNDFIITRDSADTTTGLKLTTEAVFWKNNLMLHIGNYNNYAPTKTGSGASGTWGISVTGNAATATTATKVSNPITFTGAVTGTWDGSSAKTVNIPSAYSLPTASATTLGGVKVGTGLSITNGVLSATSTAYTLPAATSSVLGGIKVGYTTTGKNYKVQLDSSNNAYVNVPWTDTNTTYNNATTAAAGLMSATDKAKLDGVASGANKYSLPTASTSTLGGIKIGTGLNINSNGVVSIDNSSTVQSISQTYTLTYDSSKSNVSRVVLALPDTFEWGKRAKLDISFYAKTSSTATSGYNIYYHDVINWESNLDSYAGGIVTAIGTDYSSAKFAVITLTPYNSSGYSALIYIQTTGGLFTSVSEVVATLKPI